VNEDLRTQMSLTRNATARNIVICALLVFCVLLICVFLPEIVSVGWHVFHGNSVKFMVWEVPVPWGWRELKGDKFIVIQRLERWNSPPSDAVVTTLDLPVGSAIDHEQWKKARIETELKKERHFMSESEVQLDGEKGFCFTFAGTERADRRWIDCSFPIHGLSIGYIGTDAHSQVLNLIIPKIGASK
jgi:hypothetical protein